MIKNFRNFIRDYYMLNMFNIFLSKNLKKYWLRPIKYNFELY